MTKPVNVDNVEIMSFKTEPPFFEVVGNPEREDVQTVCRTLINYGASPMLWGDRDIPEFFAKVGNGFALVRQEGELKLVFLDELATGQQILCVQSYRQELTPQQLQILRRSSLFLYGLEGELDELRYSPEQKESMKRRMLSSFNRQVAKQLKPSRPSFAVGDEVPAKKRKETEEVFALDD
jgi:hypothetical protein